MQEQIRMLADEKKEDDRRHALQNPYPLSDYSLLFCRRQIIQAERLKIIQEHASNLIGYLPKGILNEDDVPLLTDDCLRRNIGRTQ